MWKRINNEAAIAAGVLLAMAGAALSCGSWKSHREWRPGPVIPPAYKALVVYGYWDFLLPVQVNLDEDPSHSNSRYFAMELNSAGEPVLAYAQTPDGSQQRRVTLATWDAAEEEWEELPAASEYPLSQDVLFSLALRSNGYPIIAHDNRYWNGTRLTVEEYDGENWLVDVVYEGSQWDYFTDEPQLQLQPNGQPMIGHISTWGSVGVWGTCIAYRKPDGVWARKQFAPHGSGSPPALAVVGDEAWASYICTDPVEGGTELWLAHGEFQPDENDPWKWTTHKLDVAAVPAYATGIAHYRGHLFIAFNRELWAAFYPLTLVEVDAATMQTLHEEDIDATPWGLHVGRRIALDVDAASGTLGIAYPTTRECMGLPPLDLVTYYEVNLAGSWESEGEVVAHSGETWWGAGVRFDEDGMPFIGVSPSPGNELWVATRPAEAGS